MAQEIDIWSPNLHAWYKYDSAASSIFEKNKRTNKGSIPAQNNIPNVKDRECSSFLNYLIFKGKNAFRHHVPIAQNAVTQLATDRSDNDYRKEKEKRKIPFLYTRVLYENMTTISFEL